MQLPESCAKKIRSMEIIFFTTMPTLHIPYVDNFATYHLSGRHKHKDMDSSTWNMLVEEMLTLVFDTHNPKISYLTALIHTEGCSIRYMDMIR